MGSSIGASVAKTSVSGAANSLTTSPGVDTTGANAIFAFVTGAGSGIGTCTVSDNKGNPNFTLIAGPGGSGGGDPFLCVYVLFGGTVGAGHTFTVTGPAGLFGVLTVDARAGVNSGSITAQDFQNGGFGGTFNNSITPPDNGSLCYLIASPNIFTASGLPSGGFSSYDVASQAGAGGVNYAQYVASQVQGAAAAVNTSLTNAGGANAWNVYLVSFKPSSYSAGGSVKIMRLSCMGVG